MTIPEIIDLLNDDLKNEYKHFNFYLHSSFTLTGLERFFLVDWLKEEARGEIEHIIQFGELIRALGGTPTTDCNDFPENLTDAKEILLYALAMEEEVVANYHTRHKQAEHLRAASNTCHHIVTMLEDQIEESQEDVDEIRKVLGKFKL